MTINLLKPSFLRRQESTSLFDVSIYYFGKSGIQKFDELFLLLLITRMLLFFSARTEKKPNEKKRVRTRAQLQIDASYIWSHETPPAV